MAPPNPITVSGDSPYYVEIRELGLNPGQDPDVGDRAVVYWEIAKADCLKVTAVPVADSEMLSLWMSRSRTTRGLL